MTEIGICECGCGNATRISTENDSSKGWVRGRSLRFIRGHSGNAGIVGHKSAQWKGGRIVDKAGYVLVMNPNHARRNSNGYVLEHLVVAGTALGRELPPSAEVHHVNGVKSLNANSNLVICEDRTYHVLLHRRAEAMRATGDAHQRKCIYCGKWCDPSMDGVAVWRLKNGRDRVLHRSCKITYDRTWRANRRDDSATTENAI